MLSSGPEELTYSLDIVDKLYKQNGFNTPRKFDELPPANCKSTSKRARAKSTQDKVTLSLDYISEKVSNKIRNEARRLGLPIRLNFVSRNKLKTKLCSSRPYDKRTCMYNKCRICRLVNDNNRDCSVKNTVYRIDCRVCNNFYIGETERTLHERLGEHLRYASYPRTPSNRHEAFAIHYREKHFGINIPDLSCTILTIESNTVKRKIFEALKITEHKPCINSKEELLTVQRFLSHRLRV